MRYKGYQLESSVQPLPNGMFAANLAIFRAASPYDKPRLFDALDYFHEAAPALEYASDWGRIWVDECG
ncbi:MAG: hypothetical protein ACRYG5_09715 [Janthinobacterium lividum]